MTPFTRLQQLVFSLLETNQADVAQGLVSFWGERALEDAAQEWQMPPAVAQVARSSLYNNMGQYHLRVSGEAVKRDGDQEAMKRGMRAGQACHEQALDLFDIAAEDLVYLPPAPPYTKNFILTLWGLGISSYYLGESHAGRKYLLLCLRLPAEDEQEAAWHSDAGNHLHKLERRPAQIVVEVAAIIAHAEQPDLWRVAGNVVGWDSYARPVMDTYKVHVEIDDIFRLQALGYDSIHHLHGRYLTLQTDSACDLFRPMQIVSIR